MELKHFVVIRITSMSKKDASFDCLLFLRSFKVYRCSIFNYPNTFRGWSFDRVKTFVDATPGCTMTIIESSNTETKAHINTRTTTNDMGLVPHVVRWGETYSGDPCQFKTKADMQAYLGTTFDGNIAAIRLMDNEESHDALINGVTPQTMIKDEATELKDIREFPAGPALKAIIEKANKEPLPKFPNGGIVNGGTEKIIKDKPRTSPEPKEMKYFENEKHLSEQKNGQPQTYAGHVITPQFIKEVRDFYADSKKEPRSRAINISGFTSDMLLSVPHDIIMKYIASKEKEVKEARQAAAPASYRERTKKKQTADVQQMSLFGM